jgi:hypothetical protein
MTANQFRRALADLGLTQGNAAKLFGLSRGTWFVTQAASLFRRGDPDKPHARGRGDAQRGRRGVTSANLAIGIVCCAESEMQHSLAPEAEGESEMSQMARRSPRDRIQASRMPRADVARVTHESFPPPCPCPPEAKIHSGARLGAQARAEPIAYSVLGKGPAGYLVRSVRMATPRPGQ